MALTPLSHCPLTTSLFPLHSWMLKCLFPVLSQLHRSHFFPWSLSNLYGACMFTFYHWRGWVPSRRGLFSLQLWPVSALAEKGIGCLSLRSQEAAVLPHCPLEQYELQHPTPPLPSLTSSMQQGTQWDHLLLSSLWPAKSFRSSQGTLAVWNPSICYLTSLITAQCQALGTHSPCSSAFLCSSLGCSAP